MADLRERKRRATRDRIAGESLRLFVKDGYVAATTERIASAADVSPRTVTRYFPAKSDLIFHFQHTWMAIFEMETAAGPQDEDGESKLRRASHRIADRIEADPEPVIAAIGVAATTSELREREIASNSRWIDLVTSAIDERSERAFAARIVGAATMGMISTVMREWVHTYPNSDMHELIDEGFDLLGAGLDAFFADD